MKETFYKLTRPDGWDFYTGDTINYRDNIGRIVKCPGFDGKGKLCSKTVLHASGIPEQAFVGAKIPCSVFLVRGKVIVEDSNKCGFSELKIIEELNPCKVFKWNYNEACNPVHPFKIGPPHEITDQHTKLLREWDSVWDSVGASVWDSVWDSVRDSVGAYIGDIFVPVVKKWKYCEKLNIKNYPFQSAVDLWKQGIVPSFDGRKWRLHGETDAKILWEGKV